MDSIDSGIKRKSRLAVFEHVLESEKISKKKKFRTNRLDLDDSSPSESELVIDDKAQTGKKRLLIRLKEEPLDLHCKWICCSNAFESWSEFNTHLMEHANANADGLICCWGKCEFKSPNQELFNQHISYHGYLTKLKNIGQNILSRNDLPNCKYKENFKIPLYLDGYTCEWEYCSYNFGSVHDFFAHIKKHVHNNPRISTKEQPIICCWKGCNLKFSSIYKLAEHLRTHTKEKIVACPTCCTLFANNTKFVDHRKRQLSTHLQSYQCSQCLKLFPSERILRNHMRAHINHYKCTMCDMTCSTPSVLAKHMRFRHIKFRPFECQECGKKFIEKHNLRTHMSSHAEDCYHCDICKFSCRTKRGLENHYCRKHDQRYSEYECHCCKKKFNRGGYLTKHLMKLHNYHWPSGHSRFRYRKDQDGIYRLQTVRYESLEVTEDLIRSESMQSAALPSNSYNLRSKTNKSDSKLDTTAIGKDTPVIKTEIGKDIWITIDDLDEDGNIIKSQVVESGSIIKENVVSDQLPNISDDDKNEITIKEEALNKTSPYC